MDENVKTLVSKYAYLVNETCRELLYSISPLYKEQVEIHEYNQIVLSQLFTQLYKTGESILLLVCKENEYEADILIRTLSEGTIRYIYMMNDDLSRKSTLVEEYYNILPEMQRLGDHKKAVEAMVIFNNLGKTKHPFQTSILSDKEIEELNKKYTKKSIREMNRKWSYKRILKDLVSKNQKYKVLFATLYSYSLSSHYIHYDGESLRMRSETLRCQALEEYELDKIHALRIISNVLAMMLLRVGEYIEQYNMKEQRCIDLILGAMELQGEIDKIVDEKIKDQY